MQEPVNDELQSSTQEQVIGAFVDEIIAAKNLPGLDDDQVRQYVKEDLSERLLDQIDRALLSALPEDRALELDKMLDDDGITPEAVQQFIVDSGVDVPKITALTMVQFRDLYLREG